MTGITARLLLQRSTSVAAVADQSYAAMLGSFLPTQLSPKRQSQQQQQQQKRYLGSKPAAKKKKEKGLPYGVDVESKRDKQLELLLSSIDAPIMKPPEPDAEEKQRRYDIGRSYNIGRFNRQNEEEHDLACKIALKQHAINMLPRKSKLEERALIIDDEGPPMWRAIPVDTPPIPGYDPEVFVEGDKQDY